ncbi:MAG: acyltransferase family protein [Candidatus Kapaibacteriota bacterium]|jgi:peptidoglycan/LPS O-acetylase OafA/YrhL
MKITQLTFTRFVAALSIIVYHFGINLFPFNSEYLSFLVKQANIGVSYFYVLSGFVMIIAYSGKGDINFGLYIKNRIARILPVYYLAMVLIIWYMITYSKDFLFTDVILHIFALQAWVPGSALSINYPGWSISVEMFFYLSFPFLFNKIYKFIDYKKLLIVSILFWVITQIIFNYFAKSELNPGFGSKFFDLMYYFPLMHVNQFILGNVTGLIYLKYFKDTKTNNDWQIIMFLVLCTFAFGFNTFFNPHNGLYSLMFIPFILMLSTNNGWVSRIFSNKTLEYAGEISFGFYILQVPIYKWTVIYLLRYNLNNEYILFLVPLLVLLLVSILSFKLFETPLRNKIKKTS